MAGIIKGKIIGIEAASTRLLKNNNFSKLSF